MGAVFNTDNKTITFHHGATFEGPVGIAGMVFAVVFIIAIFNDFLTSLPFLLISITLLSLREDYIYHYASKKLFIRKKVLFFGHSTEEAIGLLDQIIIHYHSQTVSRRFIITTNTAREKGYFLSLGKNGNGIKKLFVYDNYKTALKHAKFLQTNTDLELIDQIKLQMQKARR